MCCFLNLFILILFLFLFLFFIIIIYLFFCVWGLGGVVVIILLDTCNKIQITCYDINNSINDF